MEPKYLYLRWGSHGSKARYVSLQHNPVVLAWLLYWYGKPFGFGKQGIRLAFRDCRVLGWTIIRLVYHRLLVPRRMNEIQLPVSGHVCVQIQRGWKVFDFRRKVVTKLFSPTVDRNIVQREITWVRCVGVHSFAPTVHRWDVERGWYEEEYVNGSRATGANWAEFSSSLAEVMVPLVGRVIQIAPVQTTRVSAYIKRFADDLERGQCTLSATPLHQEEIRQVQHFVTEVIDRLNQVGDQPLFLTRSHGSFALEHVLKTEKDSILIDWESSGCRSVLFDLYDGFFRWLRGRAAASGMTDAMENAIAQLQARLAASMPAESSPLISSLSSVEIYRWTYYLERLGRLLKGTTGISEDRLVSFLRFYSAFELFEEELRSRYRQAVSGQSG